MHICKTKIVANISPFYGGKIPSFVLLPYAKNFFSKILPLDVKLGNYFWTMGPDRLLSEIIKVFISFLILFLATENRNYYDRYDFLPTIWNMFVGMNHEHLGYELETFNAFFHWCAKMFFEFSFLYYSFLTNTRFWDSWIFKLHIPKKFSCWIICI